MDYYNTPTGKCEVVSQGDCLIEVQVVVPTTAAQVLAAYRRIVAELAPAA